MCQNSAILRRTIDPEGGGSANRGGHAPINIRRMARRESRNEHTVCRRMDNSGTSGARPDEIRNKTRGIILREIKFRQWSSGCFHYWGHGVGSFTGPLSNRLDIPSEQFTGLHDKNGKEIYEGDILSDGETVFFDGGGFTPFAIPGWEITTKADCIEVIGNIHENPELLNAH